MHDKTSYLASLKTTGFSPLRRLSVGFQVTIEVFVAAYGVQYDRFLVPDLIGEERELVDHAKLADPHPGQIT